MMNRNLTISSKDVASPDMARRRRLARYAVTTAVGACLSLSTLIAADPALANDECGAPVAGRVTCTATGNPYANGITYAPGGDLSLTANSDTVVTGPLTVQNAGSGNIDVTSKGSVTASTQGGRGLDISGNNVSASNQGSIVTSGPPIPFEFGDNGIIPEKAATGIFVNAVSNATVVNDGSISTTGQDASGISASSKSGSVTVINNGAISATGGFFGDTSAGILVRTEAGPTTVVNNGSIFTSQSGINQVDISSIGDVTYGGTGSIKTGTSIAGFTIRSGGAVNAFIARFDGSGKDIVSANIVVGGTGPVALTLGDITYGNKNNQIQVVSEDDITTVVQGAVVGETRVMAAGNVNFLIDKTGSLRGLEDSPVAGLGISNLVISANGGKGGIRFENRGSFDGSIEFSGTGNSIINSGLFVPKDLLIVGSSTGAGSRFTNSGTLKIVRPDFPAFAFIGTVPMVGVTEFRNSGLVDMRTGYAGDSVIVAGTNDTNGRLAVPGAFTGSGDSTLALDLFLNGGDSETDKLIATGAITGSTNVVFNQVSGAAALNPGIVFAQGGAGSSPTAFSISGVRSTPVVSYSSRFDPSTNSYALVGTPGDTLVRTARINEAANQLWYRSADTVSSHFAEIRDARFGDYAKGGGRVWGTAYGQVANRKGALTTDTFGVSRDVEANYKQDTFGGQLGFDVVGYDDGDGFAVGITGGYQNSALSYNGSADRARFNTANAGLLLGYHAGGLFANALGKFDYYWVRAHSPDADYSDKFTGRGYGGQGELGYRFGSAGFYLEPVATIAYVRTDLDRTRLSDIEVDFGTFQGLRGKAGARVGSRLDLGGGAVAVLYAQGNYVHEFKGDGATRFEENGIEAAQRNRALPDYGEGKLGFSAGSAGGVTGFVEGFGTVGRSYHGGGGRAGLRVPM